MNQLTCVLLLVCLFAYFASCRASSSFAYEITFSLSNMTVSSLDVAGQTALSNTVMDVLEVIQVQFRSQEPTDFGVSATVAVVVGLNEYLADGSLDSGFEYLNDLLNETISTGDFTDLLRENCRSADAGGMDYVVAENESPQYVRYDDPGTHYDLSPGGIAGIVITGLFFLAICGVLIFLYIQHQRTIAQEKANTQRTVEFAKV